MIPLRFGPASRQLFGLYQPPTRGIDREQCVVLCNPFGQEAIRCHRLLRVLADRLSRAGLHVLRFDYFGTGDSDGDDTEGDLPAWIDDVLRADEEVRRRSGHPACSWFGLRLGATLAALAAARDPPPQRLVLWDPVVDGAAYLDDLRVAHATFGWKPGPADAQPVLAAPSPHLAEALGFPLTEAVRRQLAALSPASFAGCRAARASIVCSGVTPSVEALRQALSAGGTTVDETVIESRIEWATDEAMNTAIVPGDALQAIVAGLGAAP